MNIVYAKAPIKVIEAMNKKTKQRIKKAIEAIPDGDILPLQGSQVLYRLRVGGWRIIFSYPDDKTILIEKISPRGDAYKGRL